jgi:GNAT superfamily N-acetyltransferase
MLCNLTTQ